MRHVLAITAGVMMASNAGAQSAEKLYQAAINREGKSCPQVTETNNLGGNEARDTRLVAVACSNGGKHVISVDTQKSSAEAIEYHQTCAAFEYFVDMDCF